MRVFTGPEDSHGGALLSFVSEALVEDKPAFTYRGVMVDTGRQFLPVPALQRMLAAMSYNKLNTMHLHLTDTARCFALAKRREETGVVVLARLEHAGWGNTSLSTVIPSSSPPPAPKLTHLRPSIPLTIPSSPNLTRFGAYGPSSVYSTKDIKELVAYALVSRTQVLPACPPA